MSAVKELSEAVEFVCELATALVKASADGKITLGDAVRLYPLLHKLPSAVSGLSVASMSELTAEDFVAIGASVKESLDLPSDKVELAIEASIDISLRVYALVQKLRA